MATYLEIYELGMGGKATPPSDLFKRIVAACTIAGELIRQEDPSTPHHDARMHWAKVTLGDPEGMANRVIWSLLAQNASYTPAQINSASDATIQNALEAAVGLLRSP